MLFKSQTTPGHPYLAIQKIDISRPCSSGFVGCRARHQSRQYLLHRLPDVSTPEVEYRTPAETITITARKDDGSMHRVQSNMGVELRHYPEDFLEIHRFLRDWYRELVVE